MFVAVYKSGGWADAMVVAWGKVLNNSGYTETSAHRRIGCALVTEGALVGQGEATQLAVVQQIHPVYVNFTQSSTDLLRLRRALEAGQLKKAPGQEGVSVRIVQPDGTEYPLPGKLLFDLSVDPSTGQGAAARRSTQPEGRAVAWPVCTRTHRASPSH